MDKLVGGLSLGTSERRRTFLSIRVLKKMRQLWKGRSSTTIQEGAVCRCLNWREAQRTMLTEDTKDAILVIEAINEEQAKRAQTAMQELKDLAKDYFGVEGTIYQLSARACKYRSLKNKAGNNRFKPCFIFFKDKEFTKDVIEDHNGHLCKEGFNQIDLALVIVDKLPDNSWELL